MLNKLIIFALIVTLLPLLGSFSEYPIFPIDENTSLSELLIQLGDEPVAHQPQLTMPGVFAERGEELVTIGITSNPKGGKTTKQSRHFVCTSCHNIQKEDPDLSKADPQARLEYVTEKGLPFLQGSTLYGAVNRTSFYNGDYEKKYGELVIPARNDLREAIQLCAVECSQGRRLEPWELESILAYLWTIDLQLGDLQLSDRETAIVKKALETETGRQETIDLLKSKYLQGSPATFGIPPEDRKVGYTGIEEGHPENGKLIYENSCLHCHENERYSFFNLDDSKASFQFLEKHFPKYTKHSVYQVTRYGTPPIPGKKAYMPNYTEEKMTDQQTEDLRAYIEQQAK
jgi:mono/diheme cytochrome c family protein